MVLVNPRVIKLLFKFMLILGILFSTLPGFHPSLNMIVRRLQLSISLKIGRHFTFEKKNMEKQFKVFAF